MCFSLSSPSRPTQSIKKCLQGRHAAPLRRQHRGFWKPSAAVRSCRFGIVSDGVRGVLGIEAFQSRRLENLQTPPGIMRFNRRVSAVDPTQLDPDSIGVLKPTQQHLKTCFLLGTTPLVPSLVCGTPATSWTYRGAIAVTTFQICWRHWWSQWILQQNWCHDAMFFVSSGYVRRCWNMCLTCLTPAFPALQRWGNRGARLCCWQIMSYSWWPWSQFH